MKTSNPIMTKSLQYYNYAMAKKKAVMEEELYPSYMPPIPKYEKIPKPKLTAIVCHFIKSNVLELKP